MLDSFLLNETKTDFYNSSTNWQRLLLFVFFQAYYHNFKLHFNSSSIESIKFKACATYFFFLHQMTTLQKLWKKLFISSKKLFSFTRHSIFCNFFPSLPHFPNSKGQWKWDNLCHKLASIYVIFRITQKPLYIVSSNLVK